MLVMYKGWGYFNYELDIDAMNKCSTKEWRVGERYSEVEQCVETCAFELPKHNEKELILRKETNIEYLLLSEHSYLDDMELSFPYSEEKDIRFYLCKDEPIYNYGCQLHERKTVKYKIGDTLPDPFIDDASKNQAESLKSIGSISDLQEIETNTQPKQTTKRKRGQTQITIFLTELCQEQDISRLSGESLVKAIKPLGKL